MGERLARPVGVLLHEVDRTERLRIELPEPGFGVGLALRWLREGQGPFCARACSILARWLRSACTP